MHVYLCGVKIFEITQITSVKKKIDELHSLKKASHFSLA